jgi:integrase
MRVFRQASKDAGIEIRFTPHGMRRTWNDIAWRIGDGRVVRAIIGHASEAMTDHYSRVDAAEKRTRAEAVAGLLDGTAKRGGPVVDEMVDDAVPAAPSNHSKPQ